VSVRQIEKFMTMTEQPYKSGLISIILVNYNGVDVLSACLRSIEKFISEPDYEIILVDNASEDSSVDVVIQNFPHINQLNYRKILVLGQEIMLA
jgi:glycosyltransferase involved in cell wall biosynthesis